MADTLRDFLEDIADAIREAEGSSGTINASDFADRIKRLSGGSPVILSFNFDNTTPGNAYGTVTLTIADDTYDDKEFTLYWADESGKLSGYDAINKLHPIIGTTEASVNWQKFVEVQGIPSGATRLVATVDGNIVASFDIPTTKQTSSLNLGTKVASIGLLSDVHIGWDSGTVVDSNPDSPTYGQNTSVNARTDLQRALTKFSNQNLDAVCVCGDLTWTADPTQFALYTQTVNQYSTIPVYATSGNHDVGTKGYVDTTAENPVITDSAATAYGSKHHTKTIKGTLWIFLGCNQYQWGDRYILGDEELAWLSALLEEHRNERVFLMYHCFIYEEYTSATYGRFNGNCKGLYAQSYCKYNAHNFPEFIALLQRYKNVIWFNGHSHIHHEYQEEDMALNYTHGQYCRMLHLSSCSGPRYGDSGLPYDPQGSEGAYLDIYPNHIVFKGYHFDEDKVEPIAEYIIDTTVVEIEPLEPTAITPTFHAHKKIDKTTGNVTDANYYASTDAIEVEAGDVVTVYMTNEVTALTGSREAKICLYNSSDEFISCIDTPTALSLPANATTGTSTPYTVESGTAYIRLRCYDPAVRTTSESVDTPFLNAIRVKVE